MAARKSEVVHVTGRGSLMLSDDVIRDDCGMRYRSDCSSSMGQASGNDGGTAEAIIKFLGIKLGDCLLQYIEFCSCPYNLVLLNNLRQSANRPPHHQALERLKIP
jgi:hypothetical protein